MISMEQVKHEGPLRRRIAEEETLQERVIEVDFATSKILLDEHREPDRSS